MMSLLLLFFAVVVVFVGNGGWGVAGLERGVDVDGWG